MYTPHDHIHTYIHVLHVQIYNHPDLLEGYLRVISKASQHMVFLRFSLHPIRASSVVNVVVPHVEVLHSLIKKDRITITAENEREVHS